MHFNYYCNNSGPLFFYLIFLFVLTVMHRLQGREQVWEIMLLKRNFVLLESIRCCVAYTRATHDDG